MNPLGTTKRQVAFVPQASYVIVVCAVHTTFHRFQSTVHQPSTHVSFTQSERVLQTDQLIIRLRSRDKLPSNVDEQRVRERVQVRCSDLVGSDLPHLLIDVRQIAASVKVRELREASGNLLTVTMYLQDTLSRFFRPGLHEVDLRVHLASASTRTLAFHESQSS